jgi:hypothetical protein
MIWPAAPPNQKRQSTSKQIRCCGLMPGTSQWTALITYGRVIAGSIDIPQVGQFAVLADPSEAVLAIFKLFGSASDLDAGD